ncbi:MAG: dUTP diphosphatase [Geminicoccaceae bacterium]
MTRPVEIAVERLAHATGLPLPQRATAGAAGIDLLAAIGEDEELKIGRFCRVLVPTGLRIALPEGYEAQVRPRSGLAARNGITVLNSPGTVDSDYRGEIKVILINLGDLPFTVKRGMRVAQMIVAPVISVAWKERKVGAHESERGDGGFGSTGTDP